MVKRSVALVIRDDTRAERLLVVLRPPDDEDLPDVWGLPAASMRSGESWAQLVRRAAKEKLGLDVLPRELLNEGIKERHGYTLEMRVYGARILDGVPDVDQPARGVTRYIGWKWAEAFELIPAAEKGSLCARLFLESEAASAP